jgi:hypothetical protein
MHKWLSPRDLDQRGRRKELKDLLKKVRKLEKELEDDMKEMANSEVVLPS